MPDFQFRATATCAVFSLDFSENSTHVTKTNLTFNAQARLETLDFGFLHDNCHELNLNFIPKNISNAFPRLIVLAFNNCPINFVTREDFEGISTLEVLNMQKCNIQNIPGDLFASMPNLQFVGFAQNFIERVGEGLLDNLENLSRADFSENICINQRVWDASEIPGFIEELYENCSGRTTLQPHICEFDDIEDFVCGLDEEIKFLNDKNEKFEKDLQHQKGEIENLKAQIENLTRENENLKTKLENEASRLDAIEFAVDKMSKRRNAKFVK
jgi:FtsZ-binding cell division protein ZapB